MNIEPQVYEKRNNLQKCCGNELIDSISAQNKEFDIILDIGCGNGNVTELLAKSVKHNRIIGVDINPNMISLANLNHKTETIDFWSQDMSVSWNEMSPQLKQLESKVSLIFSNYAFHCFANKKQLLEVLSRLLSKNGSINARFILNPDLNERANAKQIELNQKYMNCLSIKQQMAVWEQSLADSGFKVAKFTVESQMWPMTRQQIKDSMPLFVQSYKQFYVDEKQFDSTNHLFYDRVLQILLNPNNDSSNEMSWKEFVENESVDEIVSRHSVVVLVCDK